MGVHQLSQAEARQIAIRREAGVLTVFAIHQDTPFDKRVEEAVDAEIDDLARWLDVELRFAAA